MWWLESGPWSDSAEHQGVPGILNTIHSSHMSAWSLGSQLIARCCNGQFSAHKLLALCPKRCGITRNYSLAVAGSFWGVQWKITHTTQECVKYFWKFLLYIIRFMDNMNIFIFIFTQMTIFLTKYVSLFTISLDSIIILNCHPKFDFFIINTSQINVGTNWDYSQSSTKIDTAIEKEMFLKKKWKVCLLLEIKWNATSFLNTILCDELSYSLFCLIE